MKRFYSIPCVICGDYIHSSREVDDNSDNDKHFPAETLLRPTTNWWNGGEVMKLSIGFGSIHDGSILFVGICDKCIDEKASNGSIFYSHDDFGSFGSLSNDKWESSTNSILRELNINEIISEDNDNEETNGDKR